MKDISSRAEVALDYPDKTYIGIFERHSRYSAGFDDKGVVIKLEHPGEERKVVDIHLAYALFGDILHDLAASKDALARVAEVERKHLVEALKRAAHDLNQHSGKSR
ncbi:MAG: hypothetical protein U1F33_01060 [Alphaproteobacteria bacterium]